MAKPLVLNRPVIAISGSAGKTTTKEMIASILIQRWHILKTYGNANAPRHTARSAERINALQKALVLEYGMSRHGEIRRSCQIIQPNIGIITNVGTAHIGNFNGDIRGIANTKSDLIRYMMQKGTLLLNADDANSKLLDTKNFKGKIITVGQKKAANYLAENVRFAKTGMIFDTKINGAKYGFYIPVYGKHNIYNALFAIAVANLLGFKPKEIQKGIAAYKKPRRRLSIYRLRNNITIIDDTFSANPNAVKAGIDVLSVIAKGRKIAVLGSMLEMGKYRTKAHKDVGRYLARKKIDKLYTYGRDAMSIAAGAIEAGYPKQNIQSYLNQENLLIDIRKEFKPNTALLFKASHGMMLYKVVNEILGIKKKS